MGIVRVRVRPCVSRIENLRRNPGTFDGNLKTKKRIRHSSHLIELAIECGIHDRSGVIDRHALARPVCTPGPAGIDEPNLDSVGFNIFAKKFRILARMQGQKRASKTRTKGRRGFGDPFFCAGDFRGIAVNKMIHSLCRRQFRYRRQNTEGVTGEKDYILWLTALTGHGGVRDLGNRVGRSGIFRQRPVIKIDRTGRLVQDHILQNGAEGARRLENFRLLFRGKFNHLGITAPLEVKNTVFTPAMLVVTNQGPRCVRRKRCLACARQPEENRSAAIIANIGRGVHRQHALARQQIVHDAEDGLLGLTGITGATDDDELPGKIDNNESG